MQWTILLRVVLAGILGGMVGLQREWARKPAGLRTHLLVAAAAAALVELGPVLVVRYEQAIGTDALRTDPLRIVEAVITAIAVLGAGTIVFQREKQSVEGLTTAASILAAATVGILVAIDLYFVGAAITAMVVLCLVGLGWLERRMQTKETSDGDE